MKSLVREKTKGKVGTFRGVGVLLLLILDFLVMPWPASLSYSLVELARELIQELH